MFRWIASAFGLGGGVSAVDTLQPATGAALGPATATPLVTLTSMNAFLIPSLFVNADNDTCSRQTERAKGIGAWLASRIPDVVCLQEMWGSNGWAVQAPLAKVGVSPIPWCGSFGFTTLDSITQYAGGRGGLWVATRDAKLPKPSPHAGARRGAMSGDDATARWRVVGTKWHTFSFSNTKSRKGAVLVHLRLANAGGTDAAAAAGGSPSLLVVNTHVDPTNANDAIRRQCGEVVSFVSEALRDATFMGAAVAAPVAAGGTQGSGTHHANAALIVCGDLNADPSEKLGSAIFAEAFGLNASVAAQQNTCCVDLGEASPTKLVDGVAVKTLPATYDGARNKLAKWPQEAHRIDLQLAFSRVGGVALRRVTPVSAEVCRFPQGGELSDHYPAEVKFRL